MELERISNTACSQPSSPEDAGGGCPVDWNEKEQRYNWELVYCELYAGGKYDNVSGDNYEYSLGLNGLGACATQYASRYMDVTVWRDGFEYTLHFQRGEIVGDRSTPAPSCTAAPSHSSPPGSPGPRPPPGWTGLQTLPVHGRHRLAGRL